ncbi:hypothetical protein [Ramlibacter sp.]|uniref:hypothetical protein n=1 Tax=Ramlibacter sp. TaxID=1917967 RepID=UPI003D0C251B
MFQLEAVTKAECISVTARPEFHGEDKVSALSLRFRIKGENNLLDLIEPGLREHHYFNKAMLPGQETVEGIELPLPNLWHPKLPTKYVWGGNDFKSRGYRWVWDWGTEAEHVDFTDAVLSRITYEIHEGGSVDIEFSVAYNGDELENDTLYGELCKLSAKGEVHIQLFAPPDLMAVKKGYRAGRTDTKPKDPNQLELGAGGSDGEHIGDADEFVSDDEDDVEHPAGSPEAALAGTEPKPQVH